MSHDDPPELAGYVPGDGRPLRHPVALTAMRVAIVLGIIGLVVPSVWATVALQSRTATAQCAATVSVFGDEPHARFQLTGPEGPGWYCYARGFGGREVLVAALGLIPG